MLTAIVNGDVYAPHPLGSPTLLLGGGVLLHVGTVDLRSIEATGVPIDVVDATGCIVAPGLIDPHEHLIGGSGEKGFATQSAEIQLRELVQAGITSVVGCLGTDTVTKTMDALIAKVKGLREEGLSAFAWTGGYDCPPVTLTGSGRRDMLLVEEVIGIGETAISDRRGSPPQLPDLAKTASEAYVGGLLTGKAGVVHFHVGELSSRLEPLRRLLDDYDVKPDVLYATHINRSDELVREAAEISHRGVYVDMDTVDRDLLRWIPTYIEAGGRMDRLTVSSDAALSSPANLLSGLRDCVLAGLFGVEAMLRLATFNTAKVLKLDGKGEIRPGADADLILLKRESLELVHVFARGRRLLKDRAMTVVERWLSESNREVNIRGQKTT